MSTYSDASLNLPVAPEYKAGKIYSLKPTDGSGDFTVSRNCIATYMDANGVLAYAPIDTPRFQWEDGSGCPRLFTEQAATNTIEYSEDLSNAVWTKALITITPNSIASPDGTLTADKITVTSAASGLDLRQTQAVAASTKYTMSWWAQKGNVTGQQYQIYDISNGSNIVIASYEADLTTDEWIRIEKTFTTPSGCTSIFIFPLAQQATLGDMYIWGVQLETGSYASSYIPNLTTGFSTRLKDDVTNTGLTSIINSTEGTLYIKMRANTSLVDVDSWITITDGTTNATDYMGIYYDNNGDIYFRIVKASVIVDELTLSLADQSTEIELVVKWGFNDYGMKIIGGGEDTGVGNVYGAGILNKITLSFNDLYQESNTEITIIELFDNAAKYDTF